jgi:hypothetical protein
MGGLLEEGSREWPRMGQNQVDQGREEEQANLPLEIASESSTTKSFEFEKLLGHSATTCPQQRQAKHLMVFLHCFLEWEVARHLEHRGRFESCPRTEGGTPRTEEEGNYLLAGKTNLSKIVFLLKTRFFFPKEPD